MSALFSLSVIAHKFDEARWIAIKHDRLTRRMFDPSYAAAASSGSANEVVSELRLKTTFTPKELVQGAWSGLDLGIPADRAACHFVSFTSIMRYASDGQVKFWLRAAASVFRKQSELQFLTDMFTYLRTRVPAASDNAEQNLFSDTYMNRMLKDRGS